MKFWDNAGIALVVGVALGAMAAFIENGRLSWAVVIGFFLLWAFAGPKMRRKP